MGYITLCSLRDVVLAPVSVKISFVGLSVMNRAEAGDMRCISEVQNYEHEPHSIIIVGGGIKHPNQALDMTAGPPLLPTCTFLSFCCCV